MSRLWISSTKRLQKSNNDWESRPEEKKLCAKQKQSSEDVSHH